MVSVRPEPGTLVVDTSVLESVCAYMAQSDFVAVDTEFHRESTYWPRLCLIQVATLGTDVLIDPLSDGIDLGPFKALLADSDLVKVMHGSRQDMEIFHHLTGKVPVSVFDTQVAAMACGLGDMVSYDGLVRQLLGKKVDKAQQMTDWSRRPMKAEQLRYARSDVTFLAQVYPIIRDRLEELGRIDWISDEMAALISPSTYENRVQDAWLRLRGRRTDSSYLTVLAAVASWRERRAQAENRPRQWVLKDEAVHALALRKPRTLDDLRNLRISGKSFVDSRRAREVLELIKQAQLGPVVEVVHPVGRGSAVSAGVTELLRCLLRTVAAELGVAPRLIADAGEIERVASGDRQVRCMSGWRYEVFGSMAARLCSGELFLGVRSDGSVEAISGVSISKGV